MKNILYNGGKYSEAELDVKFGTFIILMGKSDKINLNIFNNLSTNENIMITPYDIYYTLSNIAIGNDISIEGSLRLLLDKESLRNKGISVFNSINPLERNCELYSEDWNTDTFCICFNE